MCEVIVFNGFWTVDDVKSNKDCLFIFGDNDVHRCKMGQAIIRDEVNTIGISTKKFPSNSISSFYTDDEYNENIKKIDKSIEKIIHKSQSYKYIVICEGLFNLNRDGEKIYNVLKWYLWEKLETLSNEYNKFLWFTKIKKEYGDI